MSDSKPPRVAANDAATPSLSLERPEVLESDPEIEALLEFEPVPRKVKRPDGWTPERQREFIHRLALCGSPPIAVGQMSKNISGIEAIYKEKGAESFRRAWDGALEVGQRRKAEQEQEQGEAFEGRAPGLNERASTGSRQAAGPLPGQVLNEYGEWEDEGSYRQRGEDARDSIGNKLIRSRRLYLQEISGSAGNRAAFEILTELPIDWEKAAALEPQEFEPWARTNQRRPDMILTAESGWSFGEHGYGPDKKAELRQAIDEHRAEGGLDPVNWDGD